MSFLLSLCPLMFVFASARRKGRRGRDSAPPVKSISREEWVVAACRPRERMAVCGQICVCVPYTLSSRAGRGTEGRSMIEIGGERQGVGDIRHPTGCVRTCKHKRVSPLGMGAVAITPTTWMHPTARFF